MPLETTPRRERKNVTPVFFFFVFFGLVVLERDSKESERTDRERFRVCDLPRRVCDDEYERDDDDG